MGDAQEEAEDPVLIYSDVLEKVGCLSKRIVLMCQRQDPMLH